MRKGDKVEGKRITTYDTGRSVGDVKRLIVDPENNRIAGFVVSQGGPLSSVDQVVSWDNVKSIGEDSIIIDNESAITGLEQAPDLKRIIDRGDNVKDVKLMTTDGREIGKISDIYLDEQTGEIQGYQVSRGIVTDATSGRQFMPATKDMQVGKDFAYVPSEVADQMQSEREREGARGVGGTMGTRGEPGQPDTGRPERLETPPRQERGQVIRLDEVRGHRLRRTVQTDDGRVIGAEGDLVTEDMIRWAQQYGKQRDLLDAAA